MTAYPSYRERLLAGISRFEPAQAAELLAFRSAAYSRSSVFCDPEYVSWCYQAPPPSDGSLWLYRKDGKIEGQQGTVPLTLKIGAQQRRAAWNLDLLVNPAFQLRGIGSVLQDVAFAPTGLSLGLEVSEDARKAYLKVGWIDLGTVPLYVRPLDPRALFEARSETTLGPLGRTLGTLGNFALRTVDSALGHALGLSQLRMEHQPRFDEQVDGLWARVSASYPVIAVRGFEALRWRFDAFPNPHRYQRFYFFDRNQLRGYAVLRIGDWNGVHAGFLVDFLCAPNDTAGLLAHVVAHFRRAQLEAIYCLQRTPASTAAFVALGFLERDSAWRLMVRVRDADSEAMRLLCDPQKWFITLGDSDVDRPREGTAFPTRRKWQLAQAG